MHHGKHDENILPELDKKLAALEKEAAARGLGATGRFPGGQLTEHDEGEIAFAVGSHEGKVVIEFGSPVAWIGLSPEQALELAKSLRSHAMGVKFGARAMKPPKRKPRGQYT